MRNPDVDYEFFSEQLARVSWKMIPRHCRYGLAAYLDRGQPTGDFLAAVLRNDLREACGRADHINQHRLFDYMSFLYMHAPAGSWGSPENFKAWIERGGLAGKPVTPS